MILAHKVADYAAALETLAAVNLEQLDDWLLAPAVRTLAQLSQRLQRPRQARDYWRRLGLTGDLKATQEEARLSYQLRDDAEALEAYQRLWELSNFSTAPQPWVIELTELSVKMCAWANLSVLFGMVEEFTWAELRQLTPGQATKLAPLHAIAYPISDRLLLKVSQTHAGKIRATALSRFQVSQEELPFWRRNSAALLAMPRRLKIAYISGDFKFHAVGLSLQNLFASHHRSRAEVYVFALNERAASVPLSAGIYDKVRRTADHWVDASRMTDLELAEQIAAEGIHVLVNCFGHTALANGVFVFQPAPIQLLHNGFLGPYGDLEALPYFTSGKS